jgi:hypothetical protein
MMAFSSAASIILDLFASASSVDIVLNDNCAPEEPGIGVAPAFNTFRNVRAVRNKFWEQWR